MARMLSWVRVTSSKQSHFSETEIRFAVRFLAAGNDVIEELDLEHVGTFRNAPRQFPVCLAGRRIAGRMVVHQDERERPATKHGREDLARMGKAFVQCPNRDQVVPVDVVASVEKENNQFFRMHGMEVVVGDCGNIDIAIKHPWEQTMQEDVGWCLAIAYFKSIGYRLENIQQTPLWQLRKI